MLVSGPALMLLHGPALMLLPGPVAAMISIRSTMTTILLPHHRFRGRDPHRRQVSRHPGSTASTVTEY
eukprot:m.34088 g.34088  ORF g.34088 m.34088 type:complete len:68 (+) comp5173_c0_seq1:617-820(+)